jgi:hypothetical protein
VESWTSQSNPSKQIALSLGCSVVGLALVVGLRDFSGSGTNTLAGFLLGALLLIVGVAGILLTTKQTVVVDPSARRITVEDASYLRKKMRSIAFNEVANVSIGYLGKRSNHVMWYYLILKLRDGKAYPLFPPGRFFEGGSDRSTVEGWQRRLEEFLAR